MKVLRKSDRVKFFIGAIEFIIAPLSHRDRIELSMAIKVVNGETVASYAEQTMLMVKKCLKSVKGLKDYQGNDYLLSFENDELSEDCLDELMNSFRSGNAVAALVKAANGNLDDDANEYGFEVLGN